MGRITDALRRAMLHKGSLHRQSELHNKTSPLPSLERKQDYSEINLEGVSPLIAAYYEVGGAILDEFQHIRANILKRQLKSLFITSSLPEDGKTLIALNLAFTVARAVKEERKRILVMDLDLYKRAFFDLLGLDHGTRGFSNALVDNTDVRDFILRDAKTGLYLLTAGSGHIKDLNALKSADILQVLKTEFDMVIADSMPVLSFVEPRELAPLFDAVLYVVRMLKTPRGSVNFGVQCLKDMGQENIFFALNGVKDFLPKKGNSYYKKY